MHMPQKVQVSRVKVTDNQRNLPPRQFLWSTHASTPFHQLRELFPDVQVPFPAYQPNLVQIALICGSIPRQYAILGFIQLAPAEGGFYSRPHYHDRRHPKQRRLPGVIGETAIPWPFGGSSLIPSTGFRYAPHLVWTDKNLTFSIPRP